MLVMTDEEYDVSAALRARAIRLLRAIMVIMSVTLVRKGGVDRYVVSYVRENVGRPGAYALEMTYGH